jgi:asparagine synthase (glutamine-hydrolysing)
VRLRLIADGPLGLFLSGGIDSGALTAVATEVADVQIRTISVGFDQPDYDETAVAAQVALALGTKHSVVRLTGQAVLDALPAFLAAIDQPTVDGFNTFLVCQSAREAGLTVALSGLGGDELFGGYASFRDVPRGRWLQSLAAGLGPAAGVARWLLRHAGLRVGVKTAELLARPNSPTHRYLLRRELFLPTERRRLHPLPSGSDPRSGLPSAVFSELDVNAMDSDAVNQVSRLELLGYMAHMLLRDADVFSMAHGIELRVPLLDHLLVEAAVPLPGAWKRPDPRPKPLLIDAVGARLPGFLTRLPKKGFTFPWGPWLRGPLRQRAEASVRNGALWSRIGFDPAVPLHLWERFLVRDRRISPLQILAFVVLEDYLERHGLQAA